MPKPKKHPFLTYPGHCLKTAEIAASRRRLHSASNHRLSDKIRPIPQLRFEAVAAMCDLICAAETDAEPSKCQPNTAVQQGIPFRRSAHLIHWPSEITQRFGRVQLRAKS